MVSFVLYTVNRKLEHLEAASAESNLFELCRVVTRSNEVKP
jgi:hypothetical protein